MNILFIAHGLNFGGASESLFILIKGLLKIGHSVSLVVPVVEDVNAQVRLEKLGVQVTVIDCGQFHSNQAGRTPLYRLPYEFIKYFKNKSQLINFIRQNNFDIVHLNSTVLSHLIRPIRQSNCVKKVFIHVRELLSRQYDSYLIGVALINMIDKWADQVVCISENEAACLKSTERIEVVYNPFEFLVSNSTIAHKNTSTEKYIIMMMGQFHPGKGQIDFLRAVRLFVDNSPELAAQCSFMLLGYTERNKSNFSRKLKDLIIKSYEENFFEVLQELKLENLIQIIPYKRNIAPELDLASIVVRTSISGDPWGRDIIESMSHGKAIIATGTYSNFVRPGFNGELVSPASPLEVADALKKIVPNHIKSYGEHSLELARQLFNADEHAQKVSKLYARAINENCI